MDENYYISHGGKIPVKWTAPEVSINHQHTLSVHLVIIIFCECMYTNDAFIALGSDSTQLYM